MIYYEELNNQKRRQERERPVYVRIEISFEQVQKDEGEIPKSVGIR
jgi:hypothetical protein